GGRTHDVHREHGVLVAGIRRFPASIEERKPTAGELFRLEEGYDVQVTLEGHSLSALDPRCVGTGGLLHDTDHDEERRRGEHERQMRGYRSAHADILRKGFVLSGRSLLSRRPRSAHET